ncbi:hypothetical protein D3C84_712910 [compost metagenome]
MAGFFMDIERSSANGVETCVIKPSAISTYISKWFTPMGVIVWVVFPFKSGSKFFSFEAGDTQKCAENGELPGESGGANATVPYTRKWSMHDGNPYPFGAPVPAFSA